MAKSERWCPTALCPSLLWSSPSLAPTFSSTYSVSSNRPDKRLREELLEGFQSCSWCQKWLKESRKCSLGQTFRLFWSIPNRIELTGLNGASWMNVSLRQIPHQSLFYFSTLLLLLLRRPSSSVQHPRRPSFQLSPFWKAVWAGHTECGGTGLPPCTAHLHRPKHRHLTHTRSWTQVRRDNEAKIQENGWGSSSDMPLSLHQAAQRNGVSLGPDADRLHKHPHVLFGPALDARRLPTLALTRPPARQSGAARGERTPLHNVSVAAILSIMQPIANRS